jgi:hypothetical protein
LTWWLDELIDTTTAQISNIRQLWRRTIRLRLSRGRIFEFILLAPELPERAESAPERVHPGGQRP